MEIPRHFLDFSSINSIKSNGRILYRIEDALGPNQAAVKSGVTQQSSNYHRAKVVQTYKQFCVERLYKRRKGEAGVPAHHFYEEPAPDSTVPTEGVQRLAPPGTYVEEALLYRLLSLSILEKNQKFMEDVETQVLPSLFHKGWYICEGLSSEQWQTLNEKVQSIKPE
jgi:hypothetical protein